MKLNQKNGKYDQKLKRLNKNGKNESFYGNVKELFNEYRAAHKFLSQKKNKKWANQIIWTILTYKFRSPKIMANINDLTICPVHCSEGDKMCVMKSGIIHIAKYPLKG